MAVLVGNKETGVIPGRLSFSKFLTRIGCRITPTCFCGFLYLCKLNQSGQCSHKDQKYNSIVYYYCMEIKPASLNLIRGTIF